MTEATEIPLDIRTYRLIVETATNVKNLTEAVGNIKTDVAALKDQFGACPCEVVTALQTEVNILQADSSNLKGKLAAIVIVFGIIASWIGNIIPNFIGRP